MATILLISLSTVIVSITTIFALASKFKVEYKDGNLYAHIEK